ncbi:MAG: hypothetical protein R3192_09570 [Woeseiaceae bacterium]|nr:hypothetical protein [Woeseiaceae bacterium]
MTRTILVLLASFSMVACVTTPREGCVGARNARQATIHYGDSELRVTPPVLNVKRTSDFTVKLNPSNARGPNGIDYANVTVTVVGKPEDEYQVNNSWIVEKSASGKNGEMYWCAPNTVDVYYYEVTVDEVGMLDPRVDVD